MADRAATTQPHQGGRGFWRARPTLRALLVATACLAGGFVMLGITLFPLARVQDDIFAGAGSTLSTLMIFLAVLPCNLVAWVTHSRRIDAVTIVLGALTLVGLPATAIALVRVGEARSLRANIAAALATVAGVTSVTALVCAVVGLPGNVLAIGWAAVVAALLSVCCILWGQVRGTRWALLASMREQTRAAERAAAAERLGRDADVARALAEERSQFAEERSALARDMHDGISHRLSIVALHAGAMSSRDDLSPEQLRAAALTVRDAAEGTGVMLREALTALRGIAEVPGSGHPTPSASSLAARVATAQARGLTVTLRWWGLNQQDLDRDHERAGVLASIVDEILINAIKYAPDEPLAIDVSVQQAQQTPAATHQLRLLASNPLPQHTPPSAIGTGFGLIGLTERAALIGGGAHYGTTTDAHFQVDVWIPWA
ncbi:signal transduction histidine kinase [Leucobacter exalbidus]|uniref:histidine kinase n=1 Tax=Leucobacter exalbidus TaxID=662960 RepID=A0A940PMU0_9MICO|nr:histidine kinase [Leucobacter exalbidus]MBP1326048.1 signal transduction histidine kinase [Leucobacter exalbidus]